MPPEDERPLPKSSDADMAAENAYESAQAASLPDDRSAVEQYAKHVSPLNRGLARFGGNLALSKRKLILGGGGLGLVGILVAGLIALLPLKLESIMKNIIAKRFDRVEFAMERRAEKVFIKYALERSSVKAALSASGAIVATGNPLTDLYATWKTQGFEKDLLGKYGINLESCIKPCKIKVSIDGKELNPNGFSSPDEFQAFLDKGELNNKEAKAFINKVLREETHFLQIYKRHNLRIWMRNAYGVRRWSFFNGKKGSDAKTEVDQAIADGEVGPELAKEPELLECTLSGGEACDHLTTKRGDHYAPQAEPEKTPTIKNGAQDLGSGNDIGGAIAEANQEALAAPAEAGANRFADTLSKFLTKEAIGKTLGVVGTLSTVAELDKTISNNTLGKLIAYKNGLQYADVFATWATVEDNIKAGTASGDEVSEAMGKLDGVEQSAAFSAVYNPGQPVTGERIGADDGVNSNSNGAARFSQAYNDDPLVKNFIHPMAQAYLNSVGVVFNVLGDLLGKVVSPLLDVAKTIVPGVSSVEDAVGTALSHILSFAIGPVLDGTETGAKLMNAIDAGADVTANDFANNLGAMPIPDQTAAAQSAAIARANGASSSIASNIANIGQSSLAAKFLAWLPSTPQATAAKLGGTGLGVIFNPIKAFSTFTAAPAYADTAVNDLYGVQQYGWTDADLNSDIQIPADVAGPPNENGNPTGPDGRVDVYDCPSSINPQAYAGKIDMCRLDMATIEDLQSTFTGADDGGLN